MTTLTEIETAIVQALQPLLDLGVRTIKALDGELTPDDIKAALRTPAVLVVYAGSRFGHENRMTTESSVWLVFVVDTSFREGAGRTGAYSVVESVRQLLDGLRPTYGGSALRLQRVDGAPVAGGGALYELEYQLHKQQIMSIKR